MNETNPSFPSKPPANVNEAVQIASNYGGIDGGHHKMWVIDQMLQALLGPDDYEKFIDWYTEDDEYEWDKGIAP